MDEKKSKRNAKVYLTAGLNLSKKFLRQDQSAVDKIVENFDPDVPSPSDLDSTREFLFNNHKSVVVDPKKHIVIPKKKKTETKKKNYDWLYVFVIILAILAAVKYLYRFLS